MRNKKGFTLIELLAVIVILAIIALIAVPVVLRIVEKAKEGAATSSATSYIKAVETYILTSDLDKTLTKLEVGATYDVVNPNGSIKAMNELVDLKGSLPTEGYIIVGDKDNVAKARLVINGFVIIYDGDTNSYTIEGTTSSGDTSSGSSGETPSTPVSFETDSWATIIAAVKSGNTSVYKVGDEKEVTLTGSVAGTYKVRVANNSNYNCTLESKTACGFVVEFKDIITDYYMNTTSTNKGGWRDSAMRTYVNNTIYNALPSDLKEGIITTTVVSGHCNSDSSNFTTSDKLYLLSTAEVWSGEHKYDTAASSTITRQLDYYANNNVTASNYAAAMKYKVGATDASDWWLRSVYSLIANSFSYMKASGAPNGNSASAAYGVVPAFRLG